MKEYIKPEVEVVVLVANESITDNGLSLDDLELGLSNNPFNT